MTVEDVEVACLLYVVDQEATVPGVARRLGLRRVAAEALLGGLRELIELEGDGVRLTQAGRHQLSIVQGGR